MIFFKMVAMAKRSQSRLDGLRCETMLPSITMSGSQLRKLLIAGAAVAALLMVATGARAAASAKLSALHVKGTQILDSKDRPVRLQGVNCASMEWTSDGEGRILQTVSNAIHEWHVNVIRLPLAQDRWFGKTPEQIHEGKSDEGKPYRALVKQVVDYCASNGCYIILDLHWSDCNEWGTNIGQHSMPDLNSIAFWKDFAPVYKNNPAVIFDLYNEPHDVSWDVWLKGGKITDKPNTRGGGPARTYECVGMQQMLDTVRASGAKNVVIAGGLDWAYDFSGILAGRELVDKKGNGVIFANHCYNNKGDSVDKWIAKMEKATATLPVIVSEFGGSSGAGGRGRRGGGGNAATTSRDNWLLHMMQAIDDHKWSFVAWDLHPSAGPTLISNWSYAPTQGFGVYVKELLAGNYPKYTPPSPVDAATNSAPATVRSANPP